jgi:nucleotide-binding universal stress UspA family protein
MAIKDILLTLTSFPKPTEPLTIERAIALAANLKANLSAIAFEMNIQSPVGLYADPLNVSGLLAADSKKSTANARDLLSIFETIAIGRNVPHDHSRIRCKPLEIPGHVTDEARFRDMTVVPLKTEDAAGREIAEHLIFGSGRPVLVLPDNPSLNPAGPLDNIAVAWDFSGPASRALADALPLIRHGKNISAFTVFDEKAIKKPAAASRLIKYLAHHGVQATSEDVTAKGRPIGDVFAAYVVEHNIDLLVMGGYGHSRTREFILGGATRSVLTRPPAAVLISH